MEWLGTWFSLHRQQVDYEKRINHYTRAIANSYHTDRRDLVDMVDLLKSHRDECVRRKACVVKCMTPEEHEQLVEWILTNS